MESRGGNLAKGSWENVMMAPLRKLLGSIGVLFVVFCSRAAAESVDALRVNFDEKGLGSLFQWGIAGDIAKRRRSAN